MDELEFRKLVYANPRDLSQEVLDAGRANPAYQKILDETLLLEDSMNSLVESLVDVPAGLHQKLLSIPQRDGQESGTVSASRTTISPIRAKKQSFFQYYAVAASLVLAVGIVFSLSFNSGPSAADVVFGNELLNHLYHENKAIDDITGGASYTVLGIDEINVSLAGAGTRLLGSQASPDFEVRWANPCEILPAYQSAHLVLQGSQGAVSIIVINNSPVDIQYSIRDERFEGKIMPMQQGNLILVGEKNEDLDHYASLFSENVEWVI
ncbi:MAG: DUF3379 family protein [Pseudohongiellaceae bacterium]